MCPVPIRPSHVCIAQEIKCEQFRLVWLNKEEAKLYHLILIAQSNVRVDIKCQFQAWLTTGCEPVVVYPSCVLTRLMDGFFLAFLSMVKPYSSIDINQHSVVFWYIYSLCMVLSVVSTRRSACYGWIIWVTWIVGSSPWMAGNGNHQSTRPCATTDSQSQVLANSFILLLCMLATAQLTWPELPYGLICQCSALHTSSSS